MHIFCIRDYASKFKAIFAILAFFAYLQPAENAMAADESRPVQAEDIMDQPTVAPDAGEQIADSSPDMEKSASEQATYPGVANKLIQAGGVDKPSLEIYYPIFGNDAVDKVLREFAQKQADEFLSEIGDAFKPGEGEEEPDNYNQWDMTGNFTLERPNPDIVSVIFNIFSYMGGAHGNLAITCLNFNLKTGAKIDFADLFRDPEKALELMSAYAAEKLTTELGEYADEDMIHSGTTPDLANFSNLTILPDGLYIEFQPYQVGPWAAGPQRVKMTLENLAPAGPEPDIWPNFKNVPDGEPAPDTVAAD